MNSQRALQIGVLIGAMFGAAALAEPTPRVYNGVLTERHPSVGALVWQGTGSSRAIINCSATLIGCNTVATAAHCVCNETYLCRSAIDATEYSVFFPSAGRFQVASIEVPEEEYRFQSGYDVAILKLTEPVNGIVPTPINLVGSPPNGTQTLLVGYGYDRGPAPGLKPESHGIKRQGKATVAACHDIAESDNHLCYKFRPPIGPPGEDSQHAGGDSGGAMLVDYGCGSALGAIVSGTHQSIFSSSNWVDLGMLTDVYAVRDFILEHGGADLESRSCGDGPHVGKPGTKIQGFGAAFNPPGTTRLFNVPPGTAELRVALTVGASRADADLYLQFGAVPTPTSHVCALTGDDQPFGICTVTSPPSGTWYALVTTPEDGLADAQVTITTLAATGPAPASTDGTACNDRSVCTAGDVCSARQCGGAAVADGTVCADRSKCTFGDACVAGTCVGGQAPRPGCLQAGKSFLKMKYAGASNNMTWKWLKGESGDFRAGGMPGNMPIDEGYAFCFYDEVAGEPRLVLDQLIPGDLAIWKSSSSGPKTRDVHTSSTGNWEGVRKLTMKHLGPGKDAIVLVGDGRARGPLPLPVSMEPQLTVQFVETVTGACWESRYTSAIQQAPERFLAKAP